MQISFTFCKLLERIIIIIITSRHLTFLFYYFLSRLIENPDGINSKLIWIFKQYTVGTLLTAHFFWLTNYFQEQSLQQTEKSQHVPILTELVLYFSYK